MVGVGDGDSERVGGVGAGDLHARQQPLDHGMDLRLLGAAGPDHRLLDQPGGIFADADPRLRGGEQDDAARLAELQRRAGIDVPISSLTLDQYSVLIIADLSHWTAGDVLRLSKMKVTGPSFTNSTCI